MYKFDHEYKATELHFQSLMKRYGPPCAILSLIRKEEKNPNESKLGREFSTAIAVLNTRFKLEAKSRRDRDTTERLLRYFQYDFQGEQQRPSQRPQWQRAAATAVSRRPPAAKARASRCPRSSLPRQSLGSSPSPSAEQSADRV